MLNALPPQQGRSEQVYQSLLDAICEGSLEPGAHLIQEQIAARLGVSRQPVQQALAILKTEGLLIEQGKRGLVVAYLALETIRHHYEVRAALDGLAARRAAEWVARDAAVRDAIADEGASLLRAGWSAVKSARLGELVSLDIAFHRFLYRSSGNPLLASSAEPHWRQLRRVMGQVLRRAQQPADVWQQHDHILAAVIAGDPDGADARAVGHVVSARTRLEQALASPSR